MARSGLLDVPRDEPRQARAGRAGRDRSYHWRIAYGSALESRSHLELLLLTGAVKVAAARQALELLDRVCAMSWRLLHPRR